MSKAHKIKTEDFKSLSELQKYVYSIEIDYTVRPDDLKWDFLVLFTEEVSNESN